MSNVPPRRCCRRSRWWGEPGRRCPPFSRWAVAVLKKRGILRSLLGASAFLSAPTTGHAPVIRARESCRHSTPHCTGQTALSRQLTTMTTKQRISSTGSTRGRATIDGGRARRSFARTRTLLSTLPAPRQLWRPSVGTFHLALARYVSLLLPASSSLTTSLSPIRVLSYLSGKASTVGQRSPLNRHDVVGTTALEGPTVRGGDESATTSRGSRAHVPCDAPLVASDLNAAALCKYVCTHCQSHDGRRRGCGERRGERKRERGSRSLLRCVTSRRVGAREREKSCARGKYIPLSAASKTRLPRTSIGSAVSITCAAGEHVPHVRGAAQGEVHFDAARPTFSPIDRENFSSRVLSK